MRGNNKKIMLGIILLAVILTCVFFMPIHRPEIKELPKVKIKNETKKKTFAIMLEDNYQDGNYTEYESDTFPTDGYTFNSEKSKCTDTNGNIVKDVLSYDYENKLIKLDTSKTVYCYIYYDRTMFFGSGTEQSPYQINHIEDLVRLSNSVNNGDSYSGKYFELTNNLDFKNKDSYENSERTDFGNINGVSETEALINELTNTEGSGFTPIGKLNKPFEGKIDGKNNRIDNLYENIKIDNLGGLFGSINGSLIKNLTLNGSLKTISAYDAGGIVGQLKNSTLDNCYGEITVTGTTGSVGGLVGIILGDSIIKNSVNKGNVSNGINTGGLVGCIAKNGISLIIENCSNTGEISTDNSMFIGGLIGRDNTLSTSSLTIKGSYNSGLVINNSDADSEQSIGGLVGKSYGELIIENSSNRNNVIINKTTYENFSKKYSGGLVGNTTNLTDTAKTKKIINSYNEGNIINGMYTAGLIGYNQGNIILIINKCYNKGLVNNLDLIITNHDLSSATISAGLLGYSVGYSPNNYIAYNYILNSYNMGEVNGLDIAVGIVGQSIFEESNILVNVYNIGNISGSTSINCIVAGLGYVGKSSNSKNNFLYVNNIYNLGIITNEINANGSYGIGATNMGIEGIVFKNTYFNNINIKGTNITNDSELTTGMSDTNMKSQTFVDTLNNNLATIDLRAIDSNLEGYTLNRWKLGPDGYPVFE